MIFKVPMKCDLIPRADVFPSETGSPSEVLNTLAQHPNSVTPPANLNKVVIS